MIKKIVFLLILILIILIQKKKNPSNNCMNLNFELKLFDHNAFKYNGINTYVISYVILFILISKLGFINTFILLILLYLCIIINRNYQIQKLKKNKITLNEFLTKADDGDVILICRGGYPSESHDIPELLTWYFMPFLFSRSIFQHAALVFTDNNGVKKAIDVRFNKKNSKKGHYIVDLKDFIPSNNKDSYIGLKAWMKLNKKLNKSERNKLLKTINKYRDIEHCNNCISLDRLSNIQLSKKKYIDYLKKNGSGCGENIFMFLYLSDLIDENKLPKYAVIPSSFEKNIHLKNRKFIDPILISNT